MGFNSGFKGLKLDNKFPSFYGTRKFITALTSARHLCLSWASSIQSIPTSYFLKIHLNTFLPSTPGSPKWSLSLRFAHQKPASPSPHICYMSRPSHSSRFYHPNNIGWAVQIMVSYWVTTNIRHHRTKFTFHGHMLPGICAPLVYSIAILQREVFVRCWN